MFIKLGIRSENVIRTERVWPLSAIAGRKEDKTLLISDTAGLTPFPFDEFGPLTENTAGRFFLTKRAQPVSDLYDSLSENRLLM
jgi:hypothetical protein